MGVCFTVRHLLSEILLAERRALRSDYIQTNHDWILVVQGWTPLMSAVSASREALIQLLLEHGADVHATNSSGQTSLHYAVRSGHLPSVLILCPICPQARQCTLARTAKTSLRADSASRCPYDCFGPD